MSHQPTSRTHRLAPAARRAWWALLILIHIPVLGSVGRSLLAHPERGNWLALAALCLTVLVFVLKLLDVPFLRFRTRPGAAIVFLLICALVHRELATTQAAQEVLKLAPMVLVVGVAIEGLRRSTSRLRHGIRLRLREAWHRLLGARGNTLLVARSFATARLADLHIFTPQILVARACIPRAPPV